MAKMTPGMKQDWKHRPAKDGRPMKRAIRLSIAVAFFLTLLVALIWFLLPPAEQRTFFFAANPIEYDLSATIPLVKSSVATELARAANHDPRTFHQGSIALEEEFPPLDDLARQSSPGLIPGRNDAFILYLQAHTLRFDSDGKSHVVVATPTFLRNSLADWQQSGVLDLRVVLDWLQTANCPLKLLLLDAGTLTVDGRIDLFENRFATALEAEMRSRKDPALFLMTSHDDGQKSLSLSLNRNSVFSQAVQEAFVGRGIVDQANDHILSVAELYHHVCVRVKDHLGDGEIRQTPRLYQGGQGVLTQDFPELFVCRYFQEDREATALDPISAAEAQEVTEEQADAEPDAAAAKPASAAEPASADADETSTSEAKAGDPRWTTLAAVWKIRDALGHPPQERGEALWSPIDFAPQDFRRLDDYLIGYQFRLLFATGSVPAENLARMQSSLKLLDTHIRQSRPIQTPPPTSDTPVDNLIESWNAFLQDPRYLAWTADLTEAGKEARDDLLAWNYCLYHVPEVVCLYELSGSDSALPDYQTLLQDLHNITVGMLELSATGSQSEELSALKSGAAIRRSLLQLQGMRRLSPADMTISTSGGPNSQMADALRLVAWLQTSLPSAADRLAMAEGLRAFSQRSVPHISFVDDSQPFLAQLQDGPLPRASRASMEKLRHLQVEIAAAGEPTNGSGNALLEIGQRLRRPIGSDTSLPEQVRYHVRVRTLDWRDLPQTIVREVPPLSLRFPVVERIPRLVVRSGRESQTVNLERVENKVDFEIALTAENFPPGEVAFEVKYDVAVLDVQFENGTFNPANGVLNYTIDANGPITIRGSVVAHRDRETNARLKQIADVRGAQRERVEFILPSHFVPPGAERGRSAQLDVTLPWAEVVDLVVAQTGASQAGVFYGQRVQIPLFANRESEFRLGVINRSRIGRKVNVSLYPVVRPAGSPMPTGRIFSQQYHRKPVAGGSGSQEAELSPWRVASFERPLANLGPDFRPIAVANGVELPPVDQIPPPNTAERGRIIHEAIDSDRLQWLTFTAPPGPPGADGKPNAGGKVPPTDLAHGLLCVIEDPADPRPDGSPRRWLRWIEWAPRQPSEYLSLESTVVPADKLRRLELVVRPLSEERSFPSASWDSSRLFGFVGLPQDLATVPIRVEWDWKWEGTFDDRELLRRQTFGTITSADGSVNMGAILNLDPSSPRKRPILVNIAAHEEFPTLRRAFRDVVNLETGQRNADDSAGFRTLRLDSYVPHVEDEQKPPPAINLMVRDWPEDRLPILLPTNTEFVDWALSLSTDTNSFNYASEINPDSIDVGLLEEGNTFDSARPGFSTRLYSNRSFSAHLTAAKPEGQLVIACHLHDITLPRMNAKSNETFVGNFVTEVRKGGNLVQDLKIPVILDKDRPTITAEPSPLEIAVNDGRRISLPVADEHSGIARLEIGEPGPAQTISGEPKLLEPLAGNIRPNPNDLFQRFPEFILNIRPEEFKWSENTTHQLRVIAVDRVGLRSTPLDLVIRVAPARAMPKETPPIVEYVIKAQVVFVNGRAAADAQYRPTIKELPLQAQRDQDGVTWIFRSPLLKPGTNYTLQSSGRQSSGGIKSAETTAQATPVGRQVPTYKLQFD